MNLQDFRDYPRDYLDLDIEDMPDRLIDRWADDAFRRICRARRWTHFQSQVTINLSFGTDEYAVALKDITSIEGPDGPLARMDPSEAERRYWNGTQYDAPNRPEAFSVWAKKVRIWPSPNTAYSLIARGVREPINWLDQGAGADPDLPDDFDDVILAWVMHKAYLHQDEPEMAAVQKATFDEGLATLARDDERTPSYTPIVLNSARRCGGNGLPSSLRFDGWVES